jgi:hypothetical protein
MRGGIQEMGSLFIGGLVFLLLIGLWGRIGGSAVTQTMTTVVQENAANAANVMEHEMRAMGYGVPMSDSAYILRADSTGISFRADLNDDGHVDTLTYAVGPGWGNPASMSIYRSFNSNPPAPVATGLTAFALKYRDAHGNAPATLRDIRALTIAMTLQGDSDLAGVRAGEYWERTIKPNNLR